MKFKTTQLRPATIVSACESSSHFPYESSFDEVVCADDIFLLIPVDKREILYFFNCLARNRIRRNILITLDVILNISNNEYIQQPISHLPDFLRFILPFLPPN